MAILFCSLISVLTKFPLVSSIILDIHYPENVLLEPYYEQFYPYPSTQSLNPNQFQCGCHQPCQCSYPDPPESVYYSSPVYRSSPTPNKPPLIIPPTAPIFSPRANFQPVQLTPNPHTIRDETKYKSEDFARSHTQQVPAQQTPNFQSTQDETKYKSVDYAQSHTETQPIPGQILQRRSLQPHFSMFQFPIDYREPQQQNIYRYIRSVQSSNFPASQIVNNSPRTHSNRGAAPISIRGRDSRSAMESSKIQNGNDVATQPPITIPEFSSNIPINFNNIRNERAASVNPLAWGRGITNNSYTTHNDQKYTAPDIHHGSPETSLDLIQKYEIVVPSRKLVSNFSDSLASMNENQFPNSNSTGGDTGKFNNTKVLIGSARSSEYGRGIYYPTGYPVYRTNLRQQRPLKYLQTISGVPNVYPGQSAAIFVQRPILNYVAKNEGNVYNPYGSLTSNQLVNSLSLPSSPPLNN